MRGSHVGLIFGAILGLALVTEGFGDMLIVALVAAIAWVVARVIEGDIDLNDVLSSASRRSASRR